MELINQLLNISEGDDLEAETVNQAKVLEGSLRNTGIHACGVIITPGDITNYVPNCYRQRFRFVCDSV